MALIHTWEEGKKHMDRCSCDSCGEIYEQRSCDTRTRRAGKLSNGLDLCTTCVKQKNAARIVECGTKYLNNRSPEERRRSASIAGRASAQSPNASVATRFSTQRWNTLTPEQQRNHVLRASRASHEKLKDPVHAAARFAKIFAQQSIGYTSKAHTSLHESIAHLGFKSHVQIGPIQVDECNEELKIVVEYNGDFWHCNPRTWQEDQYNRVIKMTAGEKWRRDRARLVNLQKLGYTTLVIWESGWNTDPQKYINRIKETVNEISSHRARRERDMLRPVDSQTP
jgi:very-short-patch-repair endonuclease